MFPRNSVHLCTVGYCRKQRIQTLYGKETCQHSNHLSPPLSKKHATAGKTPGCKQWHLCTTGPLRIQSLYGKETCQPSTSMSHSPLFKEANHLHKKTPMTHTVNSEHLYTADTAINKRIKPCVERGNSAIYPHSPASARVQTKINFTFPPSI